MTITNDHHERPSSEGLMNTIEAVKAQSTSMLGQVAGFPTSELVSVVFPAYQEEPFLAGAVEACVKHLRERGANFEVVVVENGSTDGTGALATDLAGRYREVRAFANAAADYGLALRRGLGESAGTYVVNFDVDLYDFEFMERAVARINEPDGPSIVVATKRGEGAVDTRNWSRRLVTKVFSMALRVGFGLKVSDTHGMKAMKRADVAPFAERCLFGKDLFDTELVLRTERAGFRTEEIPYVVRETRPARTPIAGRILRSIRGLVRLRVALWREARGAGRA